jgi:hypothetical protein
VLFLAKELEREEEQVELAQLEPVELAQLEPVELEAVV